MVYTKEDQLIEETKMVRKAAGTEHEHEDDDAYDDDAYDGADPDDMLNDEPQEEKKRGNLRVGKTNALDRAALNDGEALDVDDLMQGEGKEADSTVFIDNLPKDEVSLRNMLTAVNTHIVELEEQFFHEEDSETERELIQNLENSNISPEEHDKNLQAFKESQHI